MPTVTILPDRVSALARRDLLWVVLAGVAFAVIVFATQNRVVGWEPGYDEFQPGHHGWVSSHSLAIISHATPGNGYVGYALATVDEQGRADYDYFDRYPVFFSAGMHALLSWKPRLSTQIYLAKQVMNLVFVLTAIAGYLLIRKITGQTLAAVAATTLAVSSRYLLFYKDMVHYDQPALLGMLVLVYAIALHKIDGRRRIIYGATLLATSLGRGYASIFVLLVWFSLEAVPTWRKQGGPFLRRMTGLLSLDAFRTLLLSAGWAGTNLLYNIHAEAFKRGIPMLETSIVHSAVNRLSLNQDFNDSYLELLNWRTFISDQLIRLVRWSFPVWGYEGSVAQSALIVALVLGSIVLVGRSLDSPRRTVLQILVVSGVLWLFAMRNLAAFHDYTAMYYLGIPLAFYGSVASLLRLPRGAWIAAITLGLAVFVGLDLRTQALHVEIGSQTSVYTHDFMNIAAALPAGSQYIHLGNRVAYAPYAFGFYLPEDFMAPIEIADYVISQDRDLLPATLTPGNSRLFLFEGTSGPGDTVR